MRISTKGRYAIAAIIDLAQKYSSDEFVSVISISEKLDISKIYLEQVFALLKRGGVVTSVKGSRGGYKLTRIPDEITVFDVLSSIEVPLFEETKETVSKKAPEIEIAMTFCAFKPLDKAIQSTLKSVTFNDLLKEVKKHSKDEEYMFYI